MTLSIFPLRYLVHYAGFDRIFNFLPVKLVWSFLVALFRTHAVCNMVALAADTIKAGEIRLNAHHLFLICPGQVKNAPLWNTNITDCSNEK